MKQSSLLSLVVYILQSTSLVLGGQGPHSTRLAKFREVQSSHRLILHAVPNIHCLRSCNIPPYLQSRSMFLGSDWLLFRDYHQQPSTPCGDLQAHGSPLHFVPFLHLQATALRIETEVHGTGEAVTQLCELPGRNLRTRETDVELEPRRAQELPLSISNLQRHGWLFKATPHNLPSSLMGRNLA